MSIFALLALSLPAIAALYTDLPVISETATLSTEIFAHRMLSTEVAGLGNSFIVGAAALRVVTPVAGYVVGGRLKTSICNWADS